MKVIVEMKMESNRNKSKLLIDVSWGLDQIFIIIRNKKVSFKQE